MDFNDSVELRTALQALTDFRHARIRCQRNLLGYGCLVKLKQDRWALKELWCRLDMSLADLVTQCELDQYRTEADIDASDIADELAQGDS